jgi:hypothetical protein
MLCGAYVAVRYRISGSVVFTDFAKLCGLLGCSLSMLVVCCGLVHCRALPGWCSCWVQLFGHLATSTLHCVRQATARSCCCSA